jgi:lipid-A-disaccharide synthase
MSEAGRATPRPVAKRILVVAGEASGDRYGARLIQEVQRLAPGVSFTGVGGRRMREAGLAPLMDAERIAVLGFFEVLTSLPVIRKAFNRCVEELRHGVDLVLLIDYPGFNLRLASRAKKAGVPVIYFVSPQVWAWKPGRVKTIAETVTKMLVIFPFEVEFYRERGVDVTFVGHPLVEILKTAGPRPDRAGVARRLGLDPERRIIGLLPGSRIKEARRNLAPILGAARLLRGRHEDLQFMIPVATTLTREAMAAMVDLPDVVLTDGDFYDAMSLCEAAIVSSGTATMETALLEVPMVIVYRLNPLTYSLARRMTSLDTFGMVNLVAGKRIVTELIQSDCTPGRIADAMDRLLTDRVLYERTRRELRVMKERLGGEGSFSRAAEIIVATLH